MHARLRKATEEKDQGFTLIELLVVMIIIGILAAIAIPVFLNQRAKARDTATKADVSTVGKEIAAYYVDGTAAVTVAVPTNASAGAAVAATISAGSTTLTTVNLSAGVRLSNQTASPTATTWCVAFTNLGGSADSGRIWRYSATGGLANGACPA